MEFDFKKATQAVNYIARKSTTQKVDKLKLMKLIWLADRFHLRKYGRPVIGDIYWAMRLGPVPGAVKDIVDSSGFPSIEKQYSEQYIKKVDDNTIGSIAESDLRVFSETDIEALEFSLKHFGNRQPGGLVNLSHKYPEWKKFELSLKSGQVSRELMDYGDFFEDPADLPHDLFEQDKGLLEDTKEIFLKNSEACNHL